MSSTPTRIFVYGTLKKGYGNHRTLGNSIFLGEAVTATSEFTMFDGGFPFVSDKFPFNEDHTGRVVGQLYETDRQDILDNLDRLEGYPYLYDKREIDVTTLDGVSYIATIYVASEGSNARLAEREPMTPTGRSRLLEWK